MLVVFNVNVLSLSMNETQPFLTIFEYEINVVITNRSLGENGKEKVLKKNNNSFGTKQIPYYLLHYM